MWATVQWHFAAKIDLKRIRASSENPQEVARAAREMNLLLQYLPASKGAAIPVGRLGPETIEYLRNRAAILPEIVRVLRCGPISAVFTVEESETWVRIWMIRPRMDSRP